MLRFKVWGPALLAGAALGGVAPAALGEAAPGSHGCNGNVVATENHSSASQRPNGNPKASVGPGYVRGGEYPGSVPAAIQKKRTAAFCSTR